VSEEDFEGVFIEITPGDEGNVSFKCGWKFPDDADPGAVDYFKSIVAGIYGILSSDPEDLVSIGDVVRSVSDFDNPVEEQEEPILVFEPDEEFLKKMEDSKVVDLSKFKPKPNSKKH
jgi:hypothetical protein